MSGEGIIGPAPIDWNRPLAPGPVRVDVNADAARAKVVREALLELCREQKLADGHRLASALYKVAQADDAVLSKLGRLLK